MNKKQLTEAEQQELLLRMKKNYTYDEATGRLTSNRYGRVVRGKKRDKKGYLCVLCRLGKKQVFIQLHHAVWAWHYGCFPAMTIDHINGDKTDNRIENLREVCQTENNLNMLHNWNPNKDTDLPSVSPHGNGYQTRMHGKVFHFQDPYEAFFHATMCGKRYK